MPNPEQVSEKDRSDLVAYLDGELNDKSTRDVEAKINSVPALRAEVDTLKRTWDLLDFLPKHEPSPSFTHRTLEQASVSQPKGSVALTIVRKAPWRRFALYAGWATAVALVAGIGFGVTTRVIPREPTDEELARDLGVIEHKKAYEQVGDIEFLRQLDTPDLFGDDLDS